mmetsp:Transcript_6954/g.10962  ORF Transcript_6954/g.10962 Transcript_6954/m.10962 type:complete len:266 (-) Transcript_6954:253-1050(-)
MLDDESDLEQTLFMVRECYVYKIPPRTSTQGYRANEWDVNKWIWSGRIKVVAKGNTCNIILEDNTTGVLFASCSVNTSEQGPESVEPVVDSSRYFVLRIEDGSGRHAFIGLGFKERSEAYDFNVSIQDHKKYVQRGGKAPAQQEAKGPSVDYSLQAGQTIHIDLKNKDGKKAIVKTGSNADSGGKSIPMLAPPPPGKTAAPPVLAPPPRAGGAPVLGTRPATGGRPADDLESLLLGPSPSYTAPPQPVNNAAKNLAAMSLDDLLK